MYALFGQIRCINKDLERSSAFSGASGALGHRLVTSQPNSDGSELYAGEEVVIAFVVSGCDGAEVFDLAEETLNAIAEAIEPAAKGQRLLAPSIGLMFAQAPRSVSIWRRA